MKFNEWYELAKLTYKGDKGRKMAVELLVKLFPNLHTYYVGNRTHSFRVTDYVAHTLAVLYNSGLAEIPGKYVTTVSFSLPGGEDFRVNEINVPGLPIIRAALDTYFDTNDTRENGEIMADGHIEG